MTEETQALVANARAAITQLRDAARQVMGHRQRDPLVLAVHAALDRLDTTDRALTSLARDLETARQERDAAELQSTRWAFESMEQRKEHAAAVRAARAETWAKAILTGETLAGTDTATVLHALKVGAAREGQ